MIANKPKMIHISCNSDFSIETKEPYFQFEKSADGENGILEKFSHSSFKELLGGIENHGIQLALVSARHSKQIGALLLECGISPVIAVNSD